MRQVDIKSHKLARLTVLWNISINILQVKVIYLTVARLNVAPSYNSQNRHIYIKKQKDGNPQVAYLHRPPTLSYPHQRCHVGWRPKHSHIFQVESGSEVSAPRGSKSELFPTLSTTTCVTGSSCRPNQPTCDTLQQATSYSTPSPFAGESGPPPRGVTLAWKVEGGGQNLSPSLPLPDPPYFPFPTRKVWHRAAACQPIAHLYRQ